MYNVLRGCATQTSEQQNWNFVNGFNRYNLLSMFIFWNAEELRRVYSIDKRNISHLYILLEISVYYQW